MAVDVPSEQGHDMQEVRSAQEWGRNIVCNERIADRVHVHGPGAVLVVGEREAGLQLPDGYSGRQAERSQTALEVAMPGLAALRNDDRVVAQRVQRPRRVPRPAA